jgi:hypothetical protein
MVYWFYFYVLNKNTHQKLGYCVLKIKKIKNQYSTKPVFFTQIDFFESKNHHFQI